MSQHQPHLFPGFAPPEGADDEHDAHYTPTLLARALVLGLAIRRWGYPPPGATIIEPSVGGGAFARIVKEAFPDCRLVGIDVDPRAEGGAFCDDFVVGSFTEWQPDEEPWAIVGNPPFKEAEEHVRHALTMHPKHLGLILPVDFLGSQGRLPFWRECAPDIVHILVPRPFTVVRDCAWIEWLGEGGGNYFMCGWFEWK